MNIKGFWEIYYHHGELTVSEPWYAEAVTGEDRARLDENVAANPACDGGMICSCDRPLDAVVWVYRAIGGPRRGRELSPWKTEYYYQV